uniref:Uncharacterized protein n=1 Tax=Oryza rufipogon TaxID=4529 RepID=A0A0E0R850_ORYRU
MNVEKLRLLTKAGTTVLLSAAERAGLSLSAVEWLGLLYKAEELEVLSAATDHGTPGALLGVALLLLAAGPAVVYLVTEEEVAVQAVVALACVVGGSATFAMSSIVSKLQSSPAEAIRDAHCLAEVAVQAVVALACVVGGSATFAMSSIVSKLPSSPAEAIRDAHCLA